MLLTVTLLWLTVVVLGGCVGVLLRRNHQLKDRLGIETELHTKALLRVVEVSLDRDRLTSVSQTLQQQYTALEKGADEVQEGYEQEYLSMGEKIQELEVLLEAARRRITELSHDQAEHYFLCLPDFLEIEQFKGFEEDFWKDAPVYEQLQRELAPEGV